MERSEIEQLKRYAEKNKGIKLFVKRLLKQRIIESNEYTITKAEKYIKDDNNVSLLVMELKDSNAKIILTKTNNKYNIYASTIEDQDGNEVMNGYAISNNYIRPIVIRDYNEEFKKEIKKLEEIEDVYEKDIQKEGLCIYGNWCGPGCSGPEPPISPVDTCCKQHDECYKENGYFSRDCNKEFIDCLAPYVVQGDKWAILMSNCFRFWS